MNSAGKQTALCALAIVVGSGVPAADAVARIPALTGVPGRLELAARLVRVAMEYDQPLDAEALLAALQELAPDEE